MLTPKKHTMHAIFSFTNSSSMDDHPPPDEQFAIKHELFVLDTNLIHSLDQTNMDSITRNLINDLMAALGLEPLGPLELYPAVDMRAPGWSFLQPITTSHISGHYFEKPGRHPHLHMDIYSCDSVEWHNIVGIVDRHLGLSNWRASFIVRDWEDDGARSCLDLAGKGARVTQEILMTPARELAFA
ncbi:MAG: hypothetical protein JWM56_325 [Candidatus Peribacteria bacterium]|nr:hypothetical protein [Candidatus Peribacteria bacterium]